MRLNIRQRQQRDRDRFLSRSTWKYAVKFVIIEKKLASGASTFQDNYVELVYYSVLFFKNKQKKGEQRNINSIKYLGDKMMNCFFLCSL